VDLVEIGFTRRLKVKSKWENSWGKRNNLLAPRRELVL